MEIVQLTSASLKHHVIALTEMLNASVSAGANIGFIQPHNIEDSRNFWLNQISPALERGKRLLLMAQVNGYGVGSVQLDYDMPDNQPHRADVLKLMVHPEARKKGAARELMIKLERLARGINRTLLTLDTANPIAERLYLSLGYERAGVIPGYARDPMEDRFEATVFLYKALKPLDA